MIKVNDRWLRITLSLVPSVLFLYGYFTSEKASLQANLVYILTTIAVCEGSRFLIYRSRTWFQPPYKKIKRLLVLIPAGVVCVSVLFVMSKMMRNYIAYGSNGLNVSEGFALHVNDKQVALGMVGSSIFYAILCFFLLMGIYGLAYHFARLEHTEKQRDRLEKEKLQAELQQLKGIVNPHFLFNNLNSLSSLISDDPARAESFLDELTKVFRYLLRNNETELTTLSQELLFMRSYYHLLQTRYGTGISMQVEIDPACESYLLPPLTLQLLVENAVKHNSIHKERPLRITIFSDQDKNLIVKNNLASREQSVESTGIGLKSINSRYLLLDHKPLVIKKDHTFFSVIIPLIPQASPKLMASQEGGKILPAQI